MQTLPKMPARGPWEELPSGLTPLEQNVKGLSFQRNCGLVSREEDFVFNVHKCRGSKTKDRERPQVT